MSWRQPLNTMTNPNDPTNPDAMTAGLTKRELFAAMAMQGGLSNPETARDVQREQLPVGALAKLFVQMADALIAALNEKGAE